MVKLIRAACKICKKQVLIEVSEDLAKNRNRYPFEYFDIHGNPEHVLMLFLDQNLAVRDAIAYKDISIIKGKGKEFNEIRRMSESDAYTSIYSSPLRLQVFLALTEGPKTEKDLMKLLKQNPAFKEDEFEALILPLLRMGLIKTKLLQNSLEMCYFLIQDFTIIRIEPKRTFKLLSEELKFKPFRSRYFQKVNEVFSNYQNRFSSGKNALIEETRICLEVRSMLKYLKLLNELSAGPKTCEELLRVGTEEAIKLLIEKEFIVELTYLTEKYYALLSELRIKKFTPKYLMPLITQKWLAKEIDSEIALSHLEFLFDSEVKT